MYEHVLTVNKEHHNKFDLVKAKPYKKQKTLNRTFQNTLQKYCKRSDTFFLTTLI